MYNVDGPGTGKERWGVRIRTTRRNLNTALTCDTVDVTLRSPPGARRAQVHSEPWFLLGHVPLAQGQPSGKQVKFGS
jgi:hypothetical protein